MSDLQNKFFTISSALKGKALQTTMEIWTTLDKKASVCWAIGNVGLGLLQVWIFFGIYSVSSLSSSEISSKVASMQFSFAFSNSVFLFFAMSTLGQILYSFYTRKLFSELRHILVGGLIALILGFYCVTIYILNLPIEGKPIKETQMKIGADVFSTVVVLLYSFYVEMIARPINTTNTNIPPSNTVSPPATLQSNP